MGEGRWTSGASHVRWGWTLGLVLTGALACGGPDDESPQPPSPLEEQASIGVLTLSTPARDAAVTGTLIVSGTLQPAAQGDVVELSVDGGPFRSATGTGAWSLELDTAGFEDGMHSLRVRARSVRGAQTQVEAAWSSLNGPVQIRLDAAQGFPQPALNSGPHLAGAGQERVGAISLAGGSGTVSVDSQELRALVYEDIPWPSFGLQLYQAVLVAPDRLHVAWFYCRLGQLTDVYMTDTEGGPLVHELAQGSCDERPRPTEAAQLPATIFAAPLVTVPFAVDGASLKLSGQNPGTVNLERGALPIYVFSTVDCSAGCGSPGWYELHALIWDAVARELELGIFYLGTDDSSVTLEYRFALPSLSRRERADFAAPWARLPPVAATRPVLAAGARGASR